MGPMCEDASIRAQPQIWSSGGKFTGSDQSALEKYKNCCNSDEGRNCTKSPTLSLFKKAFTSIKWKGEARVASAAQDKLIKVLP